MRELLKIVLLTLISPFAGYSQILIEGEQSNIIYSHVNNRIQYLGDENCEGLKMNIEGFDKEFEFENCEIGITYLKIDTSKVEIKNQQNEILFDTILVKNKNEGRAFLKIGDKLINEGTITKEELSLIDSVKVIYKCPWIPERKIHGYTLAVIDSKGDYLSYGIRDSKIPDGYKTEIQKMKDPQTIYIVEINWSPITCFEKINSIVLDIE